MRARVLAALALPLALTLWAAVWSPPAAAAQSGATGVVVHSAIPKKVCVGDSFVLFGSIHTAGPADLAPPLAWLPLARLDAKAELGRITPGEMEQYNTGFPFALTYTAAQPGSETITLTANQGLGVTQESFTVEEQCDYDAFLTTVLHLNADAGDYRFQSLTHVTGTGTMKRDREGSPFYQGAGTWHLEELVLTKPPECVEYYSPPLIMSGPFELDGRLADEGDTVDVILSFQPNTTQSFYHGETICVNAIGETGYGSSHSQGGDPALASKINAAFPASGGSQVVTLEGAGMDIVESVADVDYTASLTLIPR